MGGGGGDSAIPVTIRYNFPSPGPRDEGALVRWFDHSLIRTSLVDASFFLALKANFFFGRYSSLFSLISCCKAFKVSCETFMSRDGKNIAESAKNFWSFWHLSDSESKYSTAFILFPASIKVALLLNCSSISSFSLANVDVIYSTFSVGCSLLSLSALRFSMAANRSSFRRSSLSLTSAILKSLEGLDAKWEGQAAIRFQKLPAWRPSWRKMI